MQIQPQLLLFQKTLLSVESISRHIEPSINLWKITRTSIEKLIIKKTY
jgi:predicted unusual protein kinase regulating ubiquinone biosynthesis (AarF/ABC1/UbiB family)